jgi:hypothetical protein
MTGKAARALRGRAEGGTWQEKQAQLKANSGWGKRESVSAWISPETPRIDHHEFGLIQSKFMVIQYKNSRASAGGRAGTGLKVWSKSIAFRAYSPAPERSPLLR